MLPRFKTSVLLRSRYCYLLVSLICISLLHSCVKDHVNQTLQPDYLQDESFFKRNDSLATFNNMLNGSNADDGFVNKMIGQFKEVDKQHKIIGTIKKYHGYPAWDLSIILKDASGLQTLVTPLKHAYSDTTEALLFSIVQGSNKTKFIIADNKKAQTKLKQYGNKEATQFTLSSFKGLFAASNESYKRAKNYTAGTATASYIVVNWNCWNYSYVYWDGPVLHAVATQWQCAGSITEVGNGGGNGGGIIDIECPAPDGGGGGGETWYYQTVTSPNQLIIDSLNGYPCAQSILAAMPSVNDQVKTILHDVFGVNGNVNLLVEPFQFTGVDSTLDGKTVKLGGDDYRMRLNISMLNMATKDYIAAVIIHEAVHAYILYNAPLSFGGGGNMDSALFVQTFPIFSGFPPSTPNDITHHNEMAANYINLMTNTLISLNPSLTNYNAQALAWGGLDRTTVWRTKADTLAILNRNYTAKYTDRQHFDSLGNPINYSYYGYKKCP